MEGMDPYKVNNVAVDASSRFYLRGLTLIPACISNYMPGKVWSEITYPFLNFNGCTVKFRNG